MVLLGFKVVGPRPRARNIVSNRARSLWEIACKVNVCSVINISRFWTFNLKIRGQQYKFLPRFADQECQNFQWNICAKFWRAKIFRACLTLTVGFV